MLKHCGTVIAFLFIAPAFLFWLMAEILSGTDVDEAPFGEDDANWKVVTSGLAVYTLIATMIVAVVTHGGMWIVISLVLAGVIVLIRFIPARRHQSSITTGKSMPTVSSNK